MGWIFLREKPGHGIQRLFLWLGKEEVQSILFLRWVQEKGLMIWGCAFISLQFLFPSFFCFAYGLVFSRHFLGLSHSRVRFWFYFAGIFSREIIFFFGVSILTIPFIF